VIVVAPARANFDTMTQDIGDNPVRQLNLDAKD
jgi:hypothetical protein